MKSVRKIISLVAAILFISIRVLTYFSWPWIMIFAGIWLSPDPPEPQVQYGEFPFEIVYQLDGELYTVSDVLVCEYDGIGVDEGVGKHIQWKGYLKSNGNEEIVLLRKDSVRIVCSIGSPEYYMGDGDYSEQGIQPDLLLIEDYESLTTVHVLTDAEGEKYKIKLISWQLSKPITNTFE